MVIPRGNLGSTESHPTGVHGKLVPRNPGLSDSIPWDWPALRALRETVSAARRCYLLVATCRRFCTQPRWSQPSLVPGPAPFLCRTGINRQRENSSLNREWFGFHAPIKHPCAAPWGVRFRTRHFPPLRAPARPSERGECPTRFQFLDTGQYRWALRRRRIPTLGHPRPSASAPCVNFPHRRAGMSLPRVSA
jgi:hypothetical protein